MSGARQRHRHALVRCILRRIASSASDGTTPCRVAPSAACGAGVRPGEELEGARGAADTDLVEVMEVMMKESEGGNIATEGSARRTLRC